jgi:NADPH:quinone reductase-like Zn-dependent oxidoreductase
MLAAEATGEGIDAIEAKDRPEPPEPGPREVALDMLAACINPADLLTLEGRYGVKPEPPFVPGAEGVARVRAVGAEVEGLAPGDVVIPFAGSAWVERMTTPAKAVVKLPADADLDQAAMLKANPATALAMLSDIVALSPGDWVAQNAANSAVGVNVIKIAKELGLKTLNVVRREAAAERLRALGADRVIVHDGGPAPEIPEAERAKLAFDAVGGAATDALAGMVADGGTVANYGLLSGDPCEMHPNHLVFRGLTLRGFWLAQWFREVEPKTIAERYARLVGWMAEGKVGAPVLARYPLRDVREAVAHAAREGRDGKILLLTDAHPEA